MKENFDRGFVSGGSFGFILGIFITVMVMTCVNPQNKSELTLSTPAPYTPEIKFRDRLLTNGCYLAATGFKDAYDAQAQLSTRGRWSSILYVNVVESTGHALCVFLYNGRWKAYDSRHGTVDLGEQLLFPPEPQEIAAKIDPAYRDAQWYK